MIRERLSYNTYHKQIFTPSHLIVNGPRVATHKGPFHCPKCRTSSEELPQGVWQQCRGCHLWLYRVGDLLEISDRFDLTPGTQTREPGTDISTPLDSKADIPPESTSPPEKDREAPKKGKEKA